MRSYSDEQLIERIIQGDAQALSELYDRYSPQLYGLALKILKNQSLAKDVIQEVFISIWKNAGQFNRRRGAPAAWITILCRNRCLDLLRLKDSQTKRSAFNPGEEIGNPALISDEDTPLKHANNEQLRSVVKSALESLPEEQKDLLELAYYQGFSQSEIAAKVGIPLGTVKTRIRSGMMQLKKIFTRIGVE